MCYTHTHIYMYVHTYTHAHTHTYIYIYIYKYVHTKTFINIYTYMHINENAAEETQRLHKHNVLDFVSQGYNVADIHKHIAVPVMWQKYIHIYI